MTGDSGDRPCGRGRDCRSDAASGADGGRKRVPIHTPDRAENCRFAAAPGQAPHGRRAFLCRGGGTTQLGLHVIIVEKPPGVDRQGADQKGETDNGD